MCVVSEGIVRGYIGVGSLGTRSEIAAELILGAGPPDQKARFLPGIGLPARSIPHRPSSREPNTGSDLASLEDPARRARAMSGRSLATRPGHASGARPI